MMGVEIVALGVVRFGEGARAGVMGAEIVVLVGRVVRFGEATQGAGRARMITTLDINPTKDDEHQALFD